ncbi:MAG: glycosyltransferase family 2 protein [Candidatus Tantalella remota]|nr:glycosyltransferase family 2 protein [Candidatus Tantalella remota]
MENVFLSILIPSYNEQQNLGNTLEEISDYLKGNSFTSEVLVVDDGSGDDTVGVAESCKGLFPDLRLIRNEVNRGKGFAVNRGVSEAKGEYILFMDADNSTSIHELDKFIPHLEDGYDAVIGSRRLEGADIVVSEPARRVIMGDFYIFLSRILFGLKLSDFNCGFKVFKNSAAKKVFSLQRMYDWSFDVEILFILDKLGMKIKEVPVRWAHKDNTSKVRPLRDGIKSFISLLTIRCNGFKRKYR